MRSRSFLYAADGAAFFALLGATFLAAFHGGTGKTSFYDPSGEPREGEVLEARWSVDQVLEKFGGTGPQKYRNADLASYLAAAEYLRTDGSWEKDYLQLWPPGQPLTIAAMIALFGPDAYPAKMIALSAVAWAAALWVVFLLVPFPKNRALRLLAAASFLLLPSYREWTFGFGAVMTESLSNAAFLIAIVLLLRGIWDPRFRWFAASGVFFGVATAFRTYFLYVGDAMILWTGIAIIAAWIVSRIRKKPLAGAKRWIAGFSIAFLAFVAVLEPWRIYKLTRIKTSALVAVNKKYAYYHSWEPADQIPHFHKAGDAACQVDPGLCKIVWANMDALRDDDVRNLVFMTIAAHPLDYAWVKLRLFNWLWFGREWRFVFFDEPWMAGEGLLLLALFAVGAVLLGRELKRTRTPEYAIASLAILLFVGVNAGVFGLYTYEWRYSQGMRTLAFFLPLLVLGRGPTASSTPKPDRP